MLASNPFLQRQFTGSRSSQNLHYQSSGRNYFPGAPQRKPNFIKPGFLITSQASLPSVSCDLRSPYSSLSYRQQGKIKKQYIQNPFYKSHLLQDTDYLNKETYNSNYYYPTTGLQQSRVQSVYTADNYQTDRYDYSKKQSKDSNSREREGLYKKQSSKDKYNQSSNIKNSSKFNDNSNKYNNFDNQPILQQVTMGVSKQLRDNNTSSNYDNNTYKKKQSGDYNNPNKYIPLNEQKPGYDTGQNYKSYINKIAKIQEVPHQQNDPMNDDPLNYNIPSFNAKFGTKRDSLQSPTFKNPYAIKNGYDEDDTWRKTNNIGIYGANAATGNTGVMTEYSDKSRGVQARNGRGDVAPKTISYASKTFYLVNIDQL